MSYVRVGRKIPVAVLAAFVFMVVAAAAATGVAPTIVRISGNGGSGDEGSWSPDLTGDGRFTVFNSYSAILVPGDANNTRDTFLYDRVSGTVERVSVSASGQEGNDESFVGFSSADGRYVAFGSEATNLVAGNAPGYTQTYVKDRQDGSLELASVNTAGASGGGYSQPSGISADGRYVLVFSHASDLVDGDTNSSPEVFLRDRDTGTTERLVVSGDGTQGDKGSWGGALTPDARFAVFQSESTNLVPGDTNGAWDVFLRDRQQGTTERVNLSSGGAQANGGSASSRPRLSPDGRYVVFESPATNLVPEDSNSAVDVFLRDRTEGTTTRISIADDGGQATGKSYDADVSSDGRYVVFVSEADDLVPGDTNGVADIFLRDRQAGTTRRLSVAADGAQADGESYDPRISSDGRYVVFAGGATNLIPGDTNGAWDVFLVDRGPAGPTVSFTDIASSPYKAAIEDLAGAGIISGYDLGDHWEFRPLNTLKRAQFAKMIVGSWSYPVTEDTAFAPFTDLGEDDRDDLYPHEFVGVAYQKGITKGTTATTFGPYLNITRAQLVTMVVRSIKNESPRALADPPGDWTGELPSSDPTHGANIRTAEYNQLLVGINLSGWNIWADATRGETAQVLYNMRGL